MRLALFAIAIAAAAWCLPAPFAQAWAQTQLFSDNFSGYSACSSPGGSWVNSGSLHTTGCSGDSSLPVPIPGLGEGVGGSGSSSTYPFANTEIGYEVGTFFVYSTSGGVNTPCAGCLTNTLGGGPYPGVVYSATDSPPGGDFSFIAYDCAGEVVGGSGASFPASIGVQHSFVLAYSCQGLGSDYTKLYVDGALVLSDTVGNLTPTNGFVVEGQEVGPSLAYEGVLVNIAVYSGTYTPPVASGNGSVVWLQ